MTQSPFADASGTVATIGLFNRPPLAPATFVIFGATGDLAMRKLIPALYNLTKDGLLPDDFDVLCVARTDMDYRRFMERLRNGVARHSRSGIDDDAWSRLGARVDYHRMDYDAKADYEGLRAKLGMKEAHNRRRRFVFYLFTPPTSFPSIIEGLGANGIVTPAHHGDGPPTRVVFEKPFGRDAASAVALNRAAAKWLDEDQLFRMDHYLGKETVQNILIFRFANAIFEPLWNRRYVHHVRITAFEKIGIEGRGRFYEETGIIRDVLQNHLLQILALCAMEPPASFDTERIRDERAKVFGALRPLEVAGDSISLGRYAGYLDEKDVAKDSTTPTFASVKLFIDNWRWAGVPFILSTGKALRDKQTQIDVHFGPVPLCLFKEQEICTKMAPNVLTIRIQPEEGITLRFCAKTPGDRQDVSPVTMDFDFQHRFKDNAQQEAYEKLLLDCLRGNQTLFARQDEVESMWRFVARIQNF